MVMTKSKSIMFLAVALAVKRFIETLQSTVSSWSSSLDICYVTFESTILLFDSFAIWLVYTCFPKKKTTTAESCSFISFFRGLRGSRGSGDENASSCRLVSKALALFLEDSRKGRLKDATVLNTTPTKTHVKSITIHNNCSPATLF